MTQVVPAEPNTLHRPAALANRVNTGVFIPAVSVSSWQRDKSYVFHLLATSLPLMISDVMAIGAAIGGLFVLGRSFQPELMPSLTAQALTLLCSFVGAGMICGLYPAIGLGRANEIRQVFRILFGIMATCLVYAFLHGQLSIESVCSWLIAGALMMALIPLGRGTARQFCSRYSWWGMPALIVGGGERAQEIWNLLKKFPGAGLKPIGVIEDSASHWQAERGAIAGNVLGCVDQIAEIAEAHSAPVAVFAMPECNEAERTRLIDDLTHTFPKLWVVPECASVGRQWTGTFEVGRTRMLQLTERLILPGNRLLKRALDLTLVLAASPIIVPVVAVIALLVKCTSKGPIFFTQLRVGHNCKLIRVWKVRSMVVNADAVLQELVRTDPAIRDEWNKYQKLANDPRITWVGKYLRRLSLDELPQLWNVFIGEMSLVGPRPITEPQIPLCGSTIALYARLQPGLTGMWQVNGRASTTFAERMLNDEEYARNWSLWMDIDILLKTIGVVVSGHGAS